MKDALAVLIVEVERFKKMTAFAQMAAAPAVLLMLLNLLGKIIDEINQLKGAGNG